MDFLKLVADRFSVRKFKNEHLSVDEINLILKAGHLAPTGCNYQPQRILVLNSDASIEKLKGCTKCHFGAPTAMLVCYNKDETWTRKYDGAISAPVDASIVTTHMMLQAYSMGIGSTWVMHFDPDAMRSTFNIPKNIIPVALLVMGYPADDAAPFNLHSEYRPIEDVVVYETF